MEKIDSSNIDAEIKSKKEELINNINNKQCCEDDFLNVWRLYSYTVLNKIEKQLTSQSNKDLTFKQAVTIGNLYRIYELLFSIHNYVTIKEIRTSSITPLHVILRCFYETCYTLEYLISEDKPELYEAFKCDSLKYLLLIYKTVEKIDRTTGGNETAKRVMRSFENTFQESNEIPSTDSGFNKRSNLLEGFQGRYKKANKEKEYDLSYRVNSQYVHGNWAILLENYLKYDKETSKYKTDINNKNHSYEVFVLSNRALIQVLNTYWLFIINFLDKDESYQELDILYDIKCNLHELNSCFDEYILKKEGR